MPVASGGIHIFQFGGGTLGHHGEYSRCRCDHFTTLGRATTLTDLATITSL
jgi:hypothetical protein